MGPINHRPTPNPDIRQLSDVVRFRGRPQIGVVAMMKLGAFVLPLMLPAMSFAAIIFEPVQYQYRDPVHNRPSFYYGGSDPPMIVAGRVQQIRMEMGANPIRNIGFSETFVGSQASNLIHHSVSGDICVTYS